MKKIAINLKSILLIFMIFVPVFLMAQIGDGEPGVDVNDSDVPFDGGVSLLVAAAVGYGLKKVHDKRKGDKLAEL